MNIIYKKSLLFIVSFFSPFAINRSYAQDVSSTRYTLKPYVIDGNFNPGDYHWMKGRFSDAPISDKLSWSKLQKWLSTCKLDDQMQMRKRMSSVGIANPVANNGPFDDIVCNQVGLAIPHVSYSKFSQLVADVKSISHVYKTLIWSAKINSNAGTFDTDDFTKELRSRVVLDQYLRNIVISDNFGIPELSSNQRAIIKSKLWVDISKVDRNNTNWLSVQVSKLGWMSIFQRSEQTFEMAWLLTQHADHDPIFQYRTLNWLSKSSDQFGVLFKKRLALLTDRVMLKVSGSQRYGSQLLCNKGEWLPFPIEDAELVDVRRKEVGLSTLEEYVSSFAEQVGKCQTR